MNHTTHVKFGDRVAELMDANRLSASEVHDDLPDIAYSKYSKWKKPWEKNCPGVSVDEAWLLANYFGAKMGIEPYKILIYLTDDSQPDGLVGMAVLAAWRGQLDVVTTPREPQVVEVIRERKGVPLPKKRRSRADAKRKHLPG
jgi:hypothetical protein